MFVCSQPFDDDDDLDFDFDDVVSQSETAVFDEILKTDDGEEGPGAQAMDLDDKNEDEDDLDTNSAATNHIEDMVLSFLTQLSVDPETRAASKSKGKIEMHLIDRKKATSNTSSTTTRFIKFPQKNKGPSSMPLARLFRVANLMHEALVEDVPTTKRDMYYKYVPLFKSQAVVDRLVDDLAATFELCRADLNVRASPKGLICGSLIKMHLNDGSTIEPSDSEGTIIISSEDVVSFDVDPDLSWVLIVEKEAVFQTLCRLELSNHPNLPGRGIIITGKGYPDVATRTLTKTLADNLPTSIPILGLVDGDPSGLEILSTYVYGSKSMRHESDKLVAGERIQWLGLYLSELTSFGVDKDMLLPITKYDEKKALSMLKQSDPALPAQWRRELMEMLHSRRKAEIEILSSSGLGLLKTGAKMLPVSGDMDQDATQPCSDNTLLQYLTIKISSAVASHRIDVACEESDDDLEVEDMD